LLEIYKNQNDVERQKQASARLEILLGSKIS